MSKMIQLRDVPDAVHRKLKSRAAIKGMSLSDFLVGEVTEIASRPTVEEMMERLSKRSGVTLSEPAAESVRSGRRDRA